MTVQGAISGEMIIYDDAKNERLGDFAAMYSTAGPPAWFDRFGIQRTAVDRGLFRKSR
jgi:hypothetical protein